MGATVTRVDYRERLLDKLQQLLAIPGGELEVVLTHACDLVASAFAADKVDAFMYDPSRDSLVALGASNQPLSAKQRQHGLDVLPLANGGRVASVFRDGRTFCTGALGDDDEELRGVKEVLGVRSTLGVPIEVGGSRRGMLMIASQQPDHFSAEDVRVAEAVVRWVGVVAHRAELAREIARRAVEQGRREVADELVTVLAHDLRNHLMPIDLRLARLEQRAAGERRGGDATDLQRARAGLARLAALIDEMLDVARIDRGVFDVQAVPFAVDELVGEVARALATPQVRVDFTPSERLLVDADPARIRQCMENLVSNAVKHSPAGATVTILGRRFLDQDRAKVLIEVIDQGPGIAQDLLPRIFDRYVAGGAERRDGGLGLGLYLAKRIAVLHGGDLTAQSTPGLGTHFLLTLPAAPDVSGM
ncbi:MAG TPA: GAF domain-containing sensor histidine kinase [Kofleriaceae bacterium]|nr:GAF domain-containing sensor histidine kinase [Kofleriaceae bacterium]